MDQLLARHRKEQRDLQSQITSQKKSATKKTRKAVNASCDELESRLRARQEAERDELNGVPPTNGRDPAETADEPPSPGQTQDSEVAKDETNEMVTRRMVQSSTINDANPARKPNRQKARLARRAAEHEAHAAEAAAEAADLPNLREQERTRMMEHFRQHGLSEHDIRPDGHCLYSAIADQLGQLGIDASSPLPTEFVDQRDGPEASEEQGYRKVRRAAAAYIAQHPEDFQPFLEESLDVYVGKIRDTAEWGGQLELLALSRSYGVEIDVVQGDGRVEKILPTRDLEKAEEGKRMWLAYYRHTYGLGEHYNSLRKAS
ncbi:MAG: hypothetical protein M1817_004360 [Caeruleum heppii]|nr:MAG: hypothetical protein M1817_004360 [Caeruleum heppii]